MLRMAHRLASPSVAARLLQAASRLVEQAGTVCSDGWWQAATGAQNVVWGSQRHPYSNDSIASGVEDINKELASYFGGIAAELNPAESSRNGSSSGSNMPGAAVQPGSSTVSSAGLQQQTTALNQELLELFGAQHLPTANGAASSAASASSPGLQLQPSGSAGSSSAGAHGRPLSSTSSSNSSGSGSSGGGGGSEPGLQPPGLTHVDAAGRAAMVDVSEKPDTVRSATATARVVLGPEVYSLVAHNQLKKGDVLTVAQLAGVIGAKYTSHLIPLCHNILLSKVGVELRLAPQAWAVDITAEARTVGPTGVEMEALTAASVAALTVYDMVKAASKDVVITDIRLQAKSGGRSGDYRRGGASDSSGGGSGGSSSGSSSRG